MLTAGLDTRELSEGLTGAHPTVDNCRLRAQRRLRADSTATIAHRADAAGRLPTAIEQPRLSPEVFGVINEAGADEFAVAVVEDHPLYRSALVETIEAHRRLTLVAVAGSVERFLTDGPHPSLVVVLDLHLPGRSGPNAVHHLTAMGHRVLALSAADDRDQVLAALTAGARGYVPKSADAAEILRAVEAVALGGSYVAPALAAKLLSSDPWVRPAHQLALSDRETQVLALLADGARDHDIAIALEISVRTVRSHLDRIREKTGRRRRPDLTRYAVEEGVLRSAAAIKDYR